MPRSSVVAIGRIVGVGDGRPRDRGDRSHANGGWVSGLRARRPSRHVSVRPLLGIGLTALAAVALASAVRDRVGRLERVLPASPRRKERLHLRRPPGGPLESRRARDDHGDARGGRLRPRRELGRRRRPGPGCERRERVDPGRHRHRARDGDDALRRDHARSGTPRGSSSSTRTPRPRGATGWPCSRSPVTRVVACVGRRQPRHRARAHPRLLRTLVAGRDRRELERRAAVLQQLRVPLREGVSGRPQRRRASRSTSSASSTAAQARGVTPRRALAASRRPPTVLAYAVRREPRCYAPGACPRAAGSWAARAESQGATLGPCGSNGRGGRPDPVRHCSVRVVIADDHRLVLDGIQPLARGRRRLRDRRRDPVGDAGPPARRPDEARPRAARRPHAADGRARVPRRVRAGTRTSRS